MDDAGLKVAVNHVATGEALPARFDHRTPRGPSAITPARRVVSRQGRPSPSPGPSLRVRSPAPAYPAQFHQDGVPARGQAYGGAQYPGMIRQDGVVLPPYQQLGYAGAGAQEAVVPFGAVGPHGGGAPLHHRFGGGNPRAPGRGQRSPPSSMNHRLFRQMLQMSEQARDREVRLIREMMSEQRVQLDAERMARSRLEARQWQLQGQEHGQVAPQMQMSDVFSSMMGGGVQIEEYMDYSQ